MEFSTFDDIEDAGLRAYNRAMQARTIAEAFDEAKAERYIKQFSGTSQQTVLSCLEAIHLVGEAAVCQWVIRNKTGGTE